MQKGLLKSELVYPSDSSFDQAIHNRKNYICDFCGLILLSRSGILSHMLHKHLGVKTSSGAQSKTEICNICGVYTTRRNYKDHVNSHSSARDYKCEFCGSAVKSIFTLRKHIKRIHMKLKSSESVDE